MRQILLPLLLFPLIPAAQAATMEIGFSLQGSTLSWFGLADPSIQGTLTVTGLPAGIEGNALAYDPGANRLLFVNGASAANHQLYGVDLMGLSFLPGAAVNAGAAANLGTLTFGAPRELLGGAFHNGSYYTLIDDTDTLVKVDFASVGGAISSNSSINLPGSAQMNLGDLAFDSSGTLWVNGFNENNIDRLWEYSSPNGTNFANEGSIAPPGNRFNGIFFDMTGTTMYGYRLASQTFGTIDPATGVFTTTYTGAPFGAGGDLATGFLADVVPETSTSLLTLAAAGLMLSRRKRPA